MRMLENVIEALEEVRRADRKESLFAQHGMATRPGDYPGPVLSMALHPSQSLRNALTVGVDAAVFVPDGAPPFEGQLPRQRPPEWIDLGRRIAEHKNQPDSYVVPLRGELPPGGQRGTLVIQPASAAARLAARLKEILASPERYPVATISAFLQWTERDVVDPAPCAFPGLNAGQSRGVALAMANTVSLIWGPPGTGKSQTIAALVAQALQCGWRTLVTSTTNKAVDAVALKLAASDNALIRSSVDGLRITRYGTVTCPGLGKISAEERSQRRRKSPQVAGDVEHVQTPCEDAVSLMTLFRTVASEIQPYDMVVVDEAGTVNLPWMIAAAALAARRLVIVGDRRQFRPIVPQRILTGATRRLCQTTAYDHLGIRYDGTDRRMALLDEQYRMRERLAAVVRMTKLYPSYRTAGGEKGMTEPGTDVLALEPMAGREVVWIDTSGTRSADNSNARHVEIGVDLARRCLAVPSAEVMVITPYFAQVRLYRRALGNHGGRLTVGTVHSMQGHEATAVIFDTVEAPAEPGTPEPKCIFSDEAALPAAETLNLLNVAVSRAQYRLLVLGNLAYLRARLPASAFLRRLAEECGRRGEILGMEAGLPGTVSGAMPENLTPEMAMATLRADMDREGVRLIDVLPAGDMDWSATGPMLAYLAGNAPVRIWADSTPLSTSSGGVTWVRGTEWPHGAAHLVLLTRGGGKVCYGGTSRLLERKVSSDACRWREPAPGFLAPLAV